MNSLVSFIINSALLGVGLAMDAFSVSMANGLSAPKMSRAMRIAIPLTFAVFQFLTDFRTAYPRRGITSTSGKYLRWTGSSPAAFLHTV
jgi:putative Mn2+ efflux pump MntP